SYFVLDFDSLIRRAGHVIRFVPYIPSQNPAVLGKMADYAFYIAFQPWVLRTVFKHMLPWALYPSRVMYMWFWRSLLAGYRKRIPAGIKEDKQWPDAVIIGQAQAMFYTGDKPRGILLVRQVMQVNAGLVHTQVSCPSQFFLDGFRTEGVFLPHLQLVDGPCRCIVGFYEPLLSGLPFV